MSPPSLRDVSRHVPPSAPVAGPCAIACTVASAEPLAPATATPLGEPRLREQLGRLGGSGYALRCLEVALEGSLFLPVSALNRLRRALVARLDEARTAAPDHGPPAGRTPDPSPPLLHGVAGGAKGSAFGPHKMLGGGSFHTEIARNIFPNGHHYWANYSKRPKPCGQVQIVLSLAPSFGGQEGGAYPGLFDSCHMLLNWSQWPAILYFT